MNRIFNVQKIIRQSFSTRTLVLRGAAGTPFGKPNPVEPEIPGYRAPGQIPTNFELATGNERYEYLKELGGQDPWADLHPIHLLSKPTEKNPLIITGSDPVRYIGCTGFPADTHEGVWLTLHPNRNERCPHCGNVFRYELDHVDDHH